MSMYEIGKFIVYKFTRVISPSFLHSWEWPSLIPRPSPAVAFQRGHSKSRNEEMRNEKWEIRKWGNGKKVHMASLTT